MPTEATKQEVAWLCTLILMRLGKNDFVGVDHYYISRLRVRFDEWMLARPEKQRETERKAHTSTEHVSLETGQ